ncbi:DUF1707 domain-containing protein [Kitasatospora sp. NPDC086801]|uniref:DUF1707 SHOCT-like domain-containing protein n=1 Tax=Kitasatospora sp. NPDC086801 TaxID=3364066 RepID=UPI0037F46E4F
MIGNMTSYPLEPKGTGGLRASDADRERTVDSLREAVAEGRLGMAEFEERLERAYRTVTVAELLPLTEDLPAARSGRRALAEPTGTNWLERIGGTATSRWAIAIMSGFNRRGRWVAPCRFRVFAFWGGGRIDLREADFESNETVIRCAAIMGGIQVLVPPGVEVVSRGLGVMGGFSDAVNGPGDPGAPRVVVTGLAFWGGVGVFRRRTDAELARPEQAHQATEEISAGERKPLN